MESKDHVGVTREIEEEWAINHQVFCYSLLSKKTYSISVKKLGAEGGYYQSDVEKGLLADGVEADFGKFLHLYNHEDDPIKLNEILNANKDAISRYVKFMYSRSKKVLTQVNSQSIYARAFRGFSHSEFLQTIDHCQGNILSVVGPRFACELVRIEDKNSRLVNNSLGFFLLPEKNGSIQLIFPLSPTRALTFLPAGEAFINHESHFLIGEKGVDIFNRFSCMFEEQLGNGFIFAQEEEDLIKPMAFIQQQVGVTKTQ